MKLTKYEKMILKAVESGQLKSIPKVKERIQQLRKYARQDIRKNKRVNLRVPGVILDGFQHRAMKEGIPYQTLMTSVLYKFVSGALVERGHR